MHSMGLANDERGPVGFGRGPGGEQPQRGRHGSNIPVTVTNEILTGFYAITQELDED